MPLGDRKLVNYDPREVIIIFGDVPLHRGIVDGTFLTIGRVSKTWRTEKGCDGEVQRVRTNDRRGIARVTMQQGAVLHAVIAALALADEKTGLGVVPLFVNDFSGHSLYSSPRAWITGYPEDAFSTVAGVRTWEIECHPLLIFPGGNKEA